MRSLIALLFLIFAVGASTAQPVADGPEGTPHREQAYRFPHLQDEGRSLYAWVYRPQGDQPRRLVIFNHHTSGDAARNQEPRHGLYPSAVAWFLDRGYVVALLHRRGYGRTGGERAMGFQCARPNHAAGGRVDAADIGTAVDQLTRLSFVQRDGVVLVGQSTGGWAVMAFAAENHPQVAAIINFGGGRRGISAQTRESCAMDELARDAGVFGARARTPSLWLYTENDRSFPPAISRRMADAYRTAGGRIDFHMLPAFGDDGHALLPNPRGAATWGPLVERFIQPFR